jgi:hypothetical protein
MHSKQTQTCKGMHKIFKRNQKELGFMNIILLHSNHRHHVSHSCGYLQGGENKNTHTIIICQTTPHLKIIWFLVKIFIFITQQTQLHRSCIFGLFNTTICFGCPNHALPDDSRSGQPKRVVVLNKSNIQNLYSFIPQVININI